jgi:hypothetical protein
LADDRLQVPILHYTNRPPRPPRWYRILRWWAWQVRRSLESFIFGAFPGEK